MVKWVRETDTFFHLVTGCSTTLRKKEEEARSFSETSDNEKGIVGKPRAEFFML